MNRQECECGCGKYAKLGNRFICGHNAKGENNYWFGKGHLISGKNNPNYKGKIKNK